MKKFYKCAKSALSNKNVNNIEYWGKKIIDGKDEHWKLRYENMTLQEGCGSPRVSNLIKIGVPISDYRAGLNGLYCHYSGHCFV